MRRLPVYLLLDCSGSMIGEPIEAVQSGVQTLVSTLRQDPYALETVFLSIITFDSKVKQTVPLTEISFFVAPELWSEGCTCLGAALELLSDCIDNEVRKTTAEQKGDWKPIVFIMTDGCPTDNYMKGIERFRQCNPSMVIACAAGPDADVDVLKQITDNVVRLDEADSETIKAFFKWVSASVSAGSMRVDNGGIELRKLKELPPPPPEVNVII